MAPILQSEATMKSETTTNDDEGGVDAITNSAATHPVGLGLGAAAGAMTGAAAGSVGGPIGVAAGAVVGAVAGAALGNSTAATISPTEEELFWQENHPSQIYEDSSDLTYEDYKPAYRLGWEGPNRYGTDFEAANSAMRSDWEERRGSSRLSWEKARPAARAAWQRVALKVDNPV